MSAGNPSKQELMRLESLLRRQQIFRLKPIAAALRRAYQEVYGHRN